MANTYTPIGRTRITLAHKTGKRCNLWNLYPLKQNSWAKTGICFWIASSFQSIFFFKVPILFWLPVFKLLMATISYIRMKWNCFHPQTAFQIHTCWPIQAACWPNNYQAIRFMKLAPVTSRVFRCSIGRWSFVVCILCFVFEQQHSNMSADSPACLFDTSGQVYWIALNLLSEIN